MTASKIFLFAKKFRLQIFLLALVALYFISAPKSEKSFKTALLNPKYDVDELTLSDPQKGSLVIKRVGSFWFAQEENPLENKSALYYICDSFMVEQFIKNLKSLVSVYEISDKKNLGAFGLQDGQSFFLCVKKGGKEVTSINFGAVDSMKRIFFSVPKRQKIFSVQSDFLAPYLSTSANFWASPEIFPKDLLGTDKKYRRGKIAMASAQEINWEGASQKIYDAQDGNVYKAFFLPKTDGDYFYRLQVQPSAQRSQEEKDALKKLNAVFIVSAWTYERVMQAD